MKSFPHKTLILGIETSCDDTSVAVLLENQVLSNLVSSQVGGIQFGGIVPELAARAHQASILPLAHAAIQEAGVSKHAINLIAVTEGPGLIGSLLVGVNFAKGLAFGGGIPLVGVHHMEAHILAAFLEKPRLEFPFVALIVSGGHTLLVLAESLGKYRVLGQTQDDAAGECFDKVARVIGLEPPDGSLMAGPVVDRRAARGDTHAFEFPRPMIRSDDLNFSFSGLKTAVINYIRKRPELLQTEQGVDDLCASFQEAIVDVLLEKSIRACRNAQINQLVLSGGVAANTRLRSRLHEASSRAHIDLHVPSSNYCTDNAAMIALTGWMHYRENGISSVNIVPRASLPLGA